MKGIIKFIANGVAVYATAYLLSGVTVESFKVSLIVALVLAALNLIVKPILSFFSLPITVMTLGLFTFVINALMVLIASRIVPGFEIDGFLTALVFSVIMTIFSYILHALID